MAYKLILTNAERAAFDWVGGRYDTGDNVSKLLIQCLPDETEWDTRGDITFVIPEHIAWQIMELSENEDNLWPCFADELKSKMLSFIDGIV